MRVMKQMIILILSMLVIFAISGCQKDKVAPNVKGTGVTTGEKSSSDLKKKERDQKPQSAVTLTVKSDKAAIVTPTKVTIQKGDTALDATQKILKQKGIQISVRGSGASAYVEGINNLYEFDRGPLSGWTAKKNGSTLGRSAGSTSVKAGDTILWIYTTDYKKEDKG